MDRLADAESCFRARSKCLCLSAGPRRASRNPVTLSAWFTSLTATWHHTCGVHQDREGVVWMATRLPSRAAPDRQEVRHPERVPHRRPRFVRHPLLAVVSYHRAQEYSLERPKYRFHRSSCQAVRQAREDVAQGRRPRSSPSNVHLTGFRRLAAMAECSPRKRL